MNNNNKHKLNNPNHLDLLAAMLLAEAQADHSTAQDFLSLLDYMDGNDRPELRCVQDFLVDALMVEKIISLDTMRQALATARPWFDPRKNRALLGLLK